MYKSSRLKNVSSRLYIDDCTLDHILKHTIHHSRLQLSADVIETAWKYDIFQLQSSKHNESVRKEIFHRLIQQWANFFHLQDRNILMALARQNAAKN